MIGVAIGGTRWYIAGTYMRQTLPFLAAMILCAGAMFVAHRSSAADETPADETPEQLIAKARSLVSYSLAGPFELQANLEIVQLNGKKQKGVYIDWAAPDKFREEIHWPRYDEIKIASGTTLYIKRSQNYTPLRAFEIERLMNVTNAIDDIQRELAAHAKSYVSATDAPGESSDDFAPHYSARMMGQVHARCESIFGAGATICIDADTGRPLEIEIINSAGLELMDYDDYTQVGSAQFARVRSYSEGSSAAIRATFKQASQVKDFPVDVFTPPRDAEMWDWCDNEIAPQRLPLKPPVPVTAETFTGPEVLDLFVDGEGTPTRATVLASGGPSADAATRELMSVARFTPAKCGAKSVKSESLYTLSGLDFLGDTSHVPYAGQKGHNIPVCIYCPDPHYSTEGFDHRVQGSILLEVEVTPDGRAHVIAIKKSLGYGLDQEAINAVQNVYRFKPALGPDGKPAAVRMEIEIDFRLYSGSR
ncbi:MAG: energy transducer TonB [Candidatus Acidiferrales bacterium]